MAGGGAAVDPDPCLSVSAGITGYSGSLICFAVLAGVHALRTCTCACVPGGGVSDGPP